MWVCVYVFTVYVSILYYIYIVYIYIYLMPIGYTWMGTYFSIDQLYTHSYRCNTHVCYLYRGIMC